MRSGVPKILWKGARDAVEQLGVTALEAYVRTLRTALEDINSHFSYLDAGAQCEQRQGLGSRVLFTGSLQVMGEQVMDAVLEMYRVNRTPFCPVPRPEPEASKSISNQTAG